MKIHPSLRWRGARAFTLAEVLIASALLGVVVTGALALTRQVLYVYNYDTGRILVNKDIRSFTQHMDTDAAYANYFLIFPNFTTRAASGKDANVADGNSGDFLVLVTTVTCVTNDIPAVGMIAGNNYITNLTGYYRDATTTTSGPVRRFSVPVNYADPTKQGTAPISTLLNTYMPTTNASSNTIIIQLAQGLANGTLFYDFQDHSVMIRGQIIESGGQGNRKAVSTYNFTVSPRG
ncbi:MAG TPA: prepilin-type N-terminal cleavage/methylation domain-containing protein [Opitutaceae bacterium]|nr:prepilin-type N-terminal cleavage/methylation domain-containing protein [Opitutaceae bacterium]